MTSCGSCGEESPDRFRFCGVCGSALPEPSTPQREIRKTVTVLFCDVVDSTRLGARLDPESLRQVMARYFDIARAALVRHGGTVEKFIGDAVMGVFGVPTIHEDDALRAVRAAAELRTALADLNVDLQGQWGVELTLRMGVNTGQVIAGDPTGGQTLVTGDPVNVAARLETAAGPGEILIGSVTASLVRDAVVVEKVTGLRLKGIDAPLDAYRLVSVTPLVLGRTRRTDTPMVGRIRESRLLAQAFERCVAENGSHLFTVLGPAGVGKSRLVHEFLAGIRSHATVLRGRCLDYGEGITYWPVVEIVRTALDATGSEGPAQLLERLSALLAAEEHGTQIAERIAALAGPDETASRVDEVPWAIRKLFEALARTRPLVVVLDDLHWAQPTLLDLVEHIADWSREAPVLLLCIARPELLDTRSAWAGGKLNATSILLEPLGATDSAALIDNLLGEITDGDAVRARIAEAAEGNPLFVEEVVAMLVEDGLLARRRDDRWEATAALDATRIPPTISALLAARLDRLASQERSVIERASVVGKTFYRTAVAELSPMPLRPDVAANLMALVRKELIRPDRSGFAGDDAFRFRHLLIRDAAYAALPRRERAELHERFASWLEEAASEQPGQFDEILGFHLEQACLQRAELGERSDGGLAHRACRFLADAGRRAYDVSDVPAAIGLLDRAHRIASPADRSTIAADLAEVLMHAGRLRHAQRVLDEAGTEVGTGQTALRLARAELRVETEPEILPELAVELDALLEAVDGSEQDHLLGRGLILLARVHWLQGQVARSTQVMERALERAQRTGNARQISQALTELAFHTLIGPTPVDDGIEMCQRFLVVAGDDRRMRASVLKTLSGLHGMRREFDESRALAAESTAILEDLGLRLAAAQASVEFAMRELFAGDPLAAEAAARRGYDVLDAMGERAYLTSCAAMLAQALHLQGLHHEAARFAAISERAAGPHDVIGQFQWRVAQARVLAGEGRFAEAVPLAEAAVAVLAPTDLLFMHGDALFDLAQILRQERRFSAAADAARAALALHERKGCVVMADHMRALLDELSDEQFAQV